jgi:hypothetical protein
MDGLVPGRIVYFVFGAHAVAEVNRRRVCDPPTARAWYICAPGAQIHFGPPVKIGDIAPAVVTRVLFPGGLPPGVKTEGRPIEYPATVNLKVMLDGSDEYWARDVQYDAQKRIGDDVPVGTWHWMYDGQAVRGSAR